MKAGARLTVLVCGAAALLAFTPAPGMALPKRAITLSSFTLEKSNGYEMEVVAGAGEKMRPVAAVTVQKGPLSAQYLVRADPGLGIHATFGSLGQLDVRFKRREKKVERPERGCRWIIETGVFRGAFHFTGEDGYVSGKAVNPKGEVFRLPDGFCGFLGDFRISAFPIPGITETILAARAESDRGAISFTASQLEFERSTARVSFDASLRERIGPLKIERTASVPGAKATFSRTGASRAAVSPPAPFVGTADFRRAAGSSPIWTGSLKVSFPGAPEVALAGETFTAKLCPRVPFLTRCLKGEPAGTPSEPSPSLYGSGSHSQPLALARLSSLR